MQLISAPGELGCEPVTFQSLVDLLYLLSYSCPLVIVISINNNKLSKGNESGVLNNPLSSSAVFFHMSNRVVDGTDYCKTVGQRVLQPRITPLL